MAIFRKSVVEKSKAVFAIKADTKEQADKVFGDFFLNDNKEYHDYRAHMDFSMQEIVTDLGSFANEDAYNRSGMVHDFFIEDPEATNKEPLYDLYIIYDVNDCHNHMAVVYGATLEQVLNRLKAENEIYILKPDYYANYMSPTEQVNIWKDHKACGTQILCYSVVGRRAIDG